MENNKHNRLQFSREHYADYSTSLIVTIREDDECDDVYTGHMSNPVIKLQADNVTQISNYGITGHLYRVGCWVYRVGWVSDWGSDWLIECECVSVCELPMWYVCMDAIDLRLETFRYVIDFYRKIEDNE